MINIFTDKDGIIKALHNSDDKELTCYSFDEDSLYYPFKGWSDAKILCYQIEVDDGRITMITPYVDTNIIEQIERLELTKASQEIVDEIEIQNLEILYQVCLLQLGISEEDINSSEQEVK